VSELNDIFYDFACAFMGTLEDEREVGFPDKLRREDLDGSIESLRVVDDYLSYVHANAERLSDEEWSTTVLWAGAYVGEVIRYNLDDSLNWVDYDEFIPERPELQSLIPERSVATCAFLVHDSGDMSMPMNKVARYIAEGGEHSVHFFAVSELHQDRSNGD
jgi:hypothetical protein